MRTRLVAAAAATALLALGLAGCSSTDASAPAAASSPSVQGPAAPIAAPQAPVRVGAEEFASVVASPGVTIVDVRTPEEFAEGHLDGAVNYNVQGAEFADQIATLDPAGTYAVYCRSGNRSQAAVAAMAQAGIPGIYELESGIVGWQEAGLPVVQ